VVDLFRIEVHHGQHGRDTIRESIRVRLPAGLHERLDQVARREERSLSEVIREALRAALNREPETDQRGGSP
jgi:metal-responsive CopG/Arc/MetJ family transcriptional regulator